MDDLLRQISQSSVWWAYFLLFLSAYVENIFPPIPGDTVTLVGAYFVGTGKLDFWGVLGSTTLGSLLGFLTLFLLAYWLEWNVLERYQPQWVKKTHLEKVKNWFQKYGYRVVLFNRFLSGVRSIISIAAGLSKLSIPKVSVLSLLGCLIWNGIIIFFGAFVGKNWEEILIYLKLYNKIIFGIILFLGAGLAVYHFFFKKNKVNDKV